MIKILEHSILRHPVLNIDEVPVLLSENQRQSNVPQLQTVLKPL